MKSQEKIFWDSAKYPGEYPKKIRKIYFKVYVSTRSPFSKWMGDISKNFREDIDWWVTLPATRNPYQSNLFHFICILKTLEILSKKKNKILVSVNSKSLFIISKDGN